MRIFLTGATGFIGSAIVPELISAGHEVLGLTRSDAGAEALLAAGAEPHRGTIEDLDSIRSGAEQSDGVIHCAFNHDFSRFVQNCDEDRQLIEAIGTVLAGSNRHLVVTSGTGMGSIAPGALALESISASESKHPNPRVASELAVESLVDQGISASVVRLPQVHDPSRQGLISYVIPIARAKGVSPYIGDGLNRWPAAHRLDVARLYRLAFEKSTPGARYNAVAEEGITARAIAEVIGRRLNLPVTSLTPEQAQEHFGWMAMFASLDMPASSAWTRKELNWTPTNVDLMTDLEVATDLEN